MTHSNKAFISASVVRSLLSFLEQRGLNKEQLCQAVNLDPEAVNDGDNTCPPETYGQLMSLAIEQLEDPNLGFHFGSAAEPDRWGVVGYLINSSESLATALTMQQKFQDLVGTIGKINFSSDEKDITLKWETKQPVIPALAEEAVTGWVAFCRWITGTTLNPKEVFFKHSKPANVTAYEEFFGCPLHFEAEFNGLIGPLEFLDLPIKRADSGVRSWLEQQAANRLKAISEVPPVVRSLETFIQSHLVQGIPDLGQAAKALEIAPRTLQKKLSDEGTSFSKVVENVRLELAKSLLKDSEYSLIEISLLVGFSEQSAFTRAFSRWSGESPTAFRRRMKAK